MPSSLISATPSNVLVLTYRNRKGRTRAVTIKRRKDKIRVGIAADQVRIFTLSRQMAETLKTALDSVLTDPAPVDLSS